MPRPGVSVHRDEAVRGERRPVRDDISAARVGGESRRPVRGDTSAERVGGAGVPGRRTVTIRGQGAERGSVGTGANGSARRRQPRPYERSGFRPDRVAMWAVLLGVMLIVVAATSSHAAVPSVHHAAAAHAVAALGLALH